MYDIIYNRTHFIFTYNNKIVKLGYLDLQIEFDIISSQIFIFTSNLEKYECTINILDNILSYTEKLLIDIYISDLYTDNIPSNWLCNICLDNINKSFIKLKCCNNIFHEDCLKKFWKNNCANKTYVKTICPLCKSHIRLDYEKCYYM
tara:strand:+ start:19 stop:459 length:441 start_codon:yes stop_codon:yes gene_type:complete